MGRGARNAAGRHLEGCEASIAGAERRASLGGPDLLGMGGGGSEIGAVLFGEERHRSTEDLQATHGEAALTINGGPVPHDDARRNAARTPSRKLKFERLH
jgi:hypothetical protein